MRSARAAYTHWQQLIVFVASISGPAAASVIEFQNKAAWQAAAGVHTTIDFTGFADGTIITTQYAAQGILFTDGVDYTFDSNAFQNDGHGLHGAIDEIAVAFDQPMSTIAVDFPGRADFLLFNDGALIYTSSHFGGSGFGFFAGLVSDQPFDAAIIFDPTGGVFIDDLFFGPPIPMPGSAVGFLTALILSQRRRRR